MKTTIATIVLCFGLSYANAQQLKEAEVPANVKDGFAKKYPGSKVDEWEKEGADYEAEFHLNKVESSAVFDASGTFKELEQEIPANVISRVHKSFMVSIDKIESIERDRIKIKDILIPISETYKKPFFELINFKKQLTIST